MGILLPIHIILILLYHIQNDGATTTATNAKFNRSFSFDGINDYVSALDTDILTFANSSSDLPYSLSLWVKPTAVTATQVIVTKGYTSGNYEYTCALATSYLQCVNYTSTASAYVGRKTAGSSITTNWQHIGVVYDGTSMNSGFKLYINGFQSDNADLASGSYTKMTNGNAIFMIGSRELAGTSNPFGGLIDDVRIYNRALTAPEITALYNYTGVDTATTTLTLNGDLTVSQGTFNASNVDLVLNGVDQNISLVGTTTVNSLTKVSTTTAGSLKFNTPINAPLIITATTTLQGTTTNMLTLGATVEGTPWYFSPDGARDFNDFTVSDSYNIASTTITASEFTNLLEGAAGGNNEGWVFGPSSTISVGRYGKQVATTTATSTAVSLGGAFTLLSTGGDTSITSITLTQHGSLATSSIDNIILSYADTIASSTCATTTPVNTNTFGATLGTEDFTATSSLTFTDTISLTEDAMVCLYVTYDTIAPTVSGSRGRTIDFEITAPQTDIITEADISTTAHVNILGQTMVTDPNITSMLSVHTKDESKNPTLYYLQDGVVYKQVGSNGTPMHLTNYNLKVQQLDFDHHINSAGSESVQTTITISNVDIDAPPSFLNVTRSMSISAFVQSWGR